MAEEEWSPVSGNDGADDGSPDSPTSLGADGFLKVDWAQRQDSIDSALLQYGLVGERLAIQEDLDNFIDQLLSETGEPVSARQKAFHLQKLKEAVLVAVAGEPLAKRLRGDLLPVAMQMIRDFAACASPRPLAPLFVGLPAKGKRLRQTGRRCLGIDDSFLSPGEREKAEKLEREKWISILVAYLIEGALPAFHMASLSSDPASTLRGTAGKTRGSTMRLYLRYWKRFRAWLLSVFKMTFPVSPIHVVDYLHVLREEPAGRTVPQKYIQSLSWIEKCGGVPVAIRLSTNPLVLRTLDFCGMELSCSSPISWQAPRYPAIVMVALELFVCSTKYSDYLRFVAWVELLHIWGTLRHDDTQHMFPRSLRVVDDVVVAEMKQTKTSGPGKRISFLSLAVSTKASLSARPWLRTGMKLMNSLGNLDRDFLLMKMLDYEGKAAGESMASYSDAVASFTLVISQLTIPLVCPDAGWIESQMRLVPAELYGFWSRHSGRCVLPSVLALLEVEKTMADNLGRWSPSGSSTYVRTYTRVVVKLQLMAVTAYHSGLGLDSLKEGDIADAMHRYLVERRDLTEELASAIILQWNGFASKVHSNWSNGAFIIPESEDGPLEELEVQLVAAAAVPSEVVQSPDSLQVVENNFLVVYGRHRKTAKLHKFSGGCFWANSSSLDCVASASVQSTQYDSRCRFCWPRNRGNVIKGLDGEKSDSDSGNSSESDTEASD